MTSPMPPLRQYLSQRRSEIQSLIKALRAELAEIDAAERGLTGAESRVGKERGSAGTGKKTLKELALEVLREAPDGLDANAILAAIKARHGLEIARESMSPQLSRLGAAGTLERDGLIWKIATPGQTRSESHKDETPGDPPPGASGAQETLEALLG